MIETIESPSKVSNHFKTRVSHAIGYILNIQLILKLCRSPQLLNMRFDLPTVLVVFLGAAQAADSSANQLCGSKQECELNCENGEYHTESLKDTTYNACIIDKPVKYAIGSCTPHQGDQDQKNLSAKVQKEFCQSMNGQICGSSSCIIVSTESSRHDFKRGCSDLRVSTAMNPDIDYQSFQSKCKRLP